ncbi:TlpA disulfide reductase family protein [uncultured Pedobacter sp.]|uniref:TlpA disulfide reductase family protein n=1 Tax=uncultured Pedobacter sp. TaxID=246139 RepID=UPI0025DDF48E|nr:TlpA disulfide reductase family protein [uncultured Pedobacter sp.]
MKKIFLILLGLFLTGAYTVKAQNKKNEYIIQGDVKAIPDAIMIYLTTSNFVDSAVVKEGKFTFKGSVGVPERANLRIKHLGQGNVSVIIHKDNLRFFLSNSNITVQSGDQFSESIIKAGKLHEDYITYYAGLLKIYEAMRPVNTKYYSYIKQNNAELVMQTRQQLDSLRAIEFSYATNFIRQNPKSPVALFAVYELAKPISNPPDFPSAFRLLDPLLQQSPLGNSISKMIVSHNFYVVGNTFPDFMQPDVTGKPIRTADFRGKYLFVDFWASWCGPCRLESPHLKRAFDRHKKDGLVVLSVSIDDSKEKWLNAIKQDQTGEFLHVGDMKGRENAAAQLLKVNMIPQNFLIDPQGKIIGKNLLGIELDEIMKKIYR